LTGLKIVFDTLKLIACEFNGHALSSYFDRETHSLFLFVLSPFYTVSCL